MKREEEKVDNRFQVKGKVKVIKGSILSPESAGLRFVLSVDNLDGKTDSAWFLLFDKKWRKVKEESKGWYATKTGARKLGSVKTTSLQSDVWAIHLLCQDEKKVINLASLEQCLKETCKMAKYEKSTVHISSLLTDAIPELKDLAIKHFAENGVSTYFYDE